MFSIHRFPFHATSALSAACVFGALAVAAPAHAQTAPMRLTADEVAKHATRTSLEIGADQAEQRAASAGVDQATAGYYPKLTASARYTRLSETDNPSFGTLAAAPGRANGERITAVTPDQPLVAVGLSFPSILNQYSLGATLSVPLSDYLLRVPHAVDAAEASDEAAGFTLRATTLRVAVDARKLYYDWVRARLQLEVARRTLDQTRAHLTDAKHLVEVGMLNQADVLRAESQVAESELLLERASNQASLNERRLRTAMHDDSNASYEIGEDVESDLAPIPQLGSQAQLQQQALERRLELKALAANERALQQQGKLARAAQLPRLDAMADAVYANPNQRIVPSRDEFKGSWSAGVQLSWTPSDIPGASAQGRAAEARASGIAARRAALADAIGVEIARALQSEHEARTAIATSTRRQASAEEAYRVRTLLFQNGRATGVEVTDAETELTRARLDLIASRVALRVAYIDLRHAIGLDVN